MKKFSRREFSKIAGSAALSSVLPLASCAQKQDQKKTPNLVFVFSDQQSRDMLGCYGNQDIITPNLDRFATEGIKFEHCVSSSPVCTPFRGMLMSGQHPLYTGTISNDYPLLANNGKYFGHVLRDAGYRTGYIGKWHLRGGDRDRPVEPGLMRYGFDDTFLTNNCHVDFRPGKCFYWNNDDEKSFFNEWEVYGQTRQALQFLDECTTDQPFALFVSWHPPHDWGIFPDSLVYKYDTIPELMQLYDRQKITLRPSVEDTPAVRRAYHGYYATCSGVDKAFGWLMDKLKEKKLEDNTLVVFASDHGDNLHSYEYTIAKNHPEDTSARIPFLMRWPNGLPKGRSSDLLISPMDMMPTLLSFMGLKVPDTVQGQDLSSAILKGRDDVVDSVPLFFYNPQWCGVYTNEYTYGVGEIQHFARNAKGDVYLKTVPLKALYDKRKDPHQLHNLFDEKSAHSLQREMQRLTKQGMDRIGDPGISRKEIDKVYLYPDGRMPQDTQEPGFRGRPIDLIKRY